MMSLEQGAYETIQQVQPTLIETIQGLLELGQSPTRIADRVARRDIALAGYVHC